MQRVDHPDRQHLRFPERERPGSWEVKLAAKRRSRSARQASRATPTPQQLRSAVAVCGAFQFRSVARRVSRYFDEALDPVGLRSTQFVLLALVGSDDGLGLSELAEAADLDRSTVTRNLRPLERDGLLRVRSEGAGRPSHAYLSAKGQRQLARAVPLWKSAQRQFEQAVGKRAWKALLPELARVRDEATELTEPA